MRSLRTRLALVALLAAAATATAVTAMTGLPQHHYGRTRERALPDNVRAVSSGYTWAENLHFSSSGQLFATELAGSVYLIEPQGDGKFTKRLWLSDPNVSRLLGLAADPDSVNMWMVGQGVDAAGDLVNLVGQFNSTHEMAWKQIAELPKLGNGLAFHAASGMLYATSGGNLFPGDGSLYRINVKTGEVTEVVVKPPSHYQQPAQRITVDTMHRGMAALQKLVVTRGEEFVQKWTEAMEKMLNTEVESNGGSDLWGADGLWIDEYSSTLFVGELMTGQVWAVSLPSEEPLGVVASIHGATSNPLLDDFTLSPDRSHLIGANWGNSSIVVTKLGSSKPLDARILLAGINNPTSVRWGPAKSAHWASSSLFVSEGKNEFPWQHDCRILEIKNAAQWLSADPDPIVRDNGRLIATE